MIPSASTIQRQHGFSLVEVTLALGIMAFCIIPAFGLLPVGINTNQAALNQTRAASVIANVCADVRGTPLTTTASPRFNISLGSATTSKTLYFSASGDTFSTNLTADSQYRADVTVVPSVVTPAGTTPAITVATLNVVVSWPASAISSNTKYQSTTAINRN